MPQALLDRVLEHRKIKKDNRNATDQLIEFIEEKLTEVNSHENPTDPS